jgi:hypothetical protein
VFENKKIEKSKYRETDLFIRGFPEMCFLRLKRVTSRKLNNMITPNTILEKVYAVLISPRDSFG